MVSPKVEPLTSFAPGVFSTTEYSKFKFLPENRPPDEKHIKRLERSIREKNLLHSNEIIVSRDFYILDGQHRFIVARDLKVPIYYKFDDIGLEDIIQMNVTHLKWDMEDYLHYHVQKGRPSYLLLNNILHNCKYVRLPVLLNLLCTFGGARETFKRGYFQFTKRADETSEVCRKIDMVIDFVLELVVVKKGHDFLKSRAFIYGLAVVLSCKDIDVGLLMEQMRLQLKSLRPCTQYNHYVDLLLQIYNYNRKKDRIKKEQLFEGRNGQED